MGLILTVLIGILAALLGGIVTVAIVGTGHTVITFIVALVAAALLVSAFSARGYGRYRQAAPAGPLALVAAASRYNTEHRRTGIRRDVPPRRIRLGH